MNAHAHNRYSYCLNSPLKFTDPSGYCLSMLERRGKREYEGFFLDNTLNDRMEWLNSGGGSYKYDFMDPGYTNWVGGGTQEGQENQETQGVTITDEATITYVLLNPGSLSELRELANDGVNYVEFFEDGDTFFGTHWIDPVYCFGKKPKGAQSQGGNTSLYFDGNRLHIWDDATGSSINSYVAYSGRGDGMNNAAAQNQKNVGPIPQGNYSFQMSNIQTNSAVDSVVGSVGGVLGQKWGGWPGGTYSWGDTRVFLTPSQYTNTYGRSGFSIHGGYSPGSAGCIDLVGNNNAFFNALQNAAGGQSQVILRVRY